MKKIISLLLLYSFFSVGQTMPHWNTQGNSLVNGQFFGSKNAKDVIFKANNATLLTLKSNGKINLPTLTNTTDQFLTTNASGDLELSKVSTSWYLENSITDAGNSKTQNIYRNGFVGINQIIPIHEVDVVGVIRALNPTTTNQFRIDPMDSLGPKLKLGTSSNPVAFLEFGAYSSINNIDSKNRDLKIFNANNTKAFIIKSTGNIGINTITPSRTLDVNGLMKIGNIAFTDSNSNVIIGNSSQSAVRTSLCGDGNYQDFQFVKTNAAANSINNWGFGQRFDTFFGNQSGSFQFIGSYINNSGVGSAVGGGYRVPIICNPDGSVIIAGASANAINGNVGVGTTTPAQKLDVTGTVQATQFKLSALNTAPTSSTSTGSVGEIRIVNGFIYVCIAVNTWQRATLNTF